MKKERSVHKMGKQARGQKSFEIGVTRHKDSPGSMVRLTVFDGSIKGLIMDTNESYRIEKLKSDHTNPYAVDHMLYRTEDIPSIDSYCGNEQNEKTEAPVIDRTSPFNSTTNRTTQFMMSGTVIGNTYLLEIATEADYDWYTKHGSNSNSVILSNGNYYKSIMCQGSNKTIPYYFSTTNINNITYHIETWDDCTSCDLVLYENQTYTSSTTINDCSVKLKSITVQNGALNIEVDNSVTIEDYFHVNEGETFELSK